MAIAQDDLRALLRAYRRGSEPAARSLHAQLAPGLRGLARTILDDDALGDDAVQSVFCRILDLPAREVRRVESARAWMATLVRREALTMRRGDARRKARESAGGMPTPGASMNEPRESDDLRRALAQLDARHQEVIHLKCALDLTFEQIALVLEVNRNTAASRYRSAIARMREQLGGGAVQHDSPKAVSHV